MYVCDVGVDVVRYRGCCCAVGCVVAVVSDMGVGDVDGVVVVVASFWV